MRPSLRRAPAVLLLGALLVLTGCSSDATSTQLPTHTLAAARYSYVGYLVPKQSTKLSLTASQLGVPLGTAVVADQPLAASTDAVDAKREALRAAASAAAERGDLAQAALAALRAGKSVSYQPTGTANTPEIRAAELDLASARTAEDRAALAYQSQRNKLSIAADAASAAADAAASAAAEAAAADGSGAGAATTDGATTDGATTDGATTDGATTDGATTSAAAQAKAAVTQANAAAAQSKEDVAFLQADRALAQRDYRTRLSGLFEVLVTACGTAQKAATDELATLDAKAPFAGMLSVRDDAVWIDSTAASFVFLATEDQVEILAAASSLELIAKGARVGTLTVASTSFDATATTSPTSPRYRVMFDVTPSDGFVPRDHGAAAVAFDGSGLAVPPAYLGHDDQGDFVLAAGTRKSVTAAKDATGQFVITGAGLAAGDVIQQVVS